MYTPFVHTRYKTGSVIFVVRAVIGIMQIYDRKLLWSVRSLHICLVYGSGIRMAFWSLIRTIVFLGIGSLGL